VGENFKEIDTDTIDVKITEIKNFNQINLGGEKVLPFVYGENLILNMEKSLDFHPNGMIFKAIFENGEILERDYYSVGGGFVATKEDNSIKENCIRTYILVIKGKM
jgi:L-serine dehydratase